MPRNEAAEYSALLDLAKVSGKLQLSTVYEGYIEFEPEKDERERIEKWLSEEIAQTLLDYVPIWAEAQENIETYKAGKQRLNDGTDILPSPLARIAADQTISWAYNKLLRPRPLLSIDPYFPAVYDVMTPMDLPGPDGAMVQTLSTMPRDAEDLALMWELGYQYLLLERINFPKKYLQILKDTVQGAGPCWIKICADHRTRPVMNPPKGSPFIDLTDKRESNVTVGDMIRWDVLPIFNCIRPVDEHDIQASPWFAELSPTTPSDFLAAHARGEYPLIDKKEADRLSRLTVERAQLNQQKTSIEQAQTKAPVTTSRQVCDTVLVWFYRDVAVKPPEGGKPIIKRVSLMGDFHVTGKKLLSCFRNPYDHQFRPYVPCFQIEDAHTLSGSSTVSITKYHQKVKTQALGLEIANASSAANNCYFADPDTDAYLQLARTGPHPPNEVIPKREDEYVEAFRKGQAHESLLPLIGYVDQDGMRAANVSAYETGENIPGRTPAATMSQVMEAGANQPLMFIRTLSSGPLIEAVKLDLRTRRQFYPMGEQLHVKDPGSDEVLKVLFQFPDEDVIDNFRFAWTATDEAIAQEHELPQLMGLYNLQQQRANFIAQVTAPMANPQMTPAQIDLLVGMLKSDQVLFDRIVSLSRTDVQHFDYTKQVARIAEEHDQAAAAMQQQAMTAQPQGGMNAGNPAEAGSAVPGEGGANGGGPPGPEGESSLPPDSGPPPQAALPPEGMVQ